MRTDFKPKDRYTVSDLVEIMALLRGEGGCPWDREQTHESIRKNLIEETYEAAEAIDSKDPEKLREELGDVLLQVVFHSEIERERGSFDFDDVCDGICRKLILRHPHIFGDESLSDSGEVADRWDEIKKESQGLDTAVSTLRAVPGHLPALMRSAKLQQRAEKACGTHHDIIWSLRKLDEEVTELKEAVRANDIVRCADEVGDVLFSAVNAARALDLEPEQCLFAVDEKFIKRVEAVEHIATESGRELPELTNAELSEIWLEAKEKIHEKREAPAE